jgi:aminotransferase
MSIECEKIKGINLAQGVCDTPVPEVVREGARLAMERGVNSYTRAEGLTDIRRAVAEKMRRFNGLECDPETEVIIHSGSTGAFYASCLALLNPGDEVILFEPYYGYHLNTLIAVDAKPVFLTLQAPNWRFSPQDLERVVTSKTRAIMVNSPANPSGKVFTREELQWIADFAQRHDLFVFTDEIYEYFIYEGRHISPATLPGMRERTITLSGFSKTYNMTGWRLGYAVAPPELTARMGIVNDLLYICAPTPLQHGVLAAFDLPASYYEQMARDYDRKRRQTMEACDAVGLASLPPQGSYYLMVDVRGAGFADDRQASDTLLSRCGVAAVPGSSFYKTPGAGSNKLRFCFCKKEETLTAAEERMRRLLVRS